jgi:hypothetical protein
MDRQDFWSYVRPTKKKIGKAVEISPSWWENIAKLRKWDLLFYPEFILVN